MAYNIKIILFVLLSILGSTFLFAQDDVLVLFSKKEMTTKALQTNHGGNLYPVSSKRAFFNLGLSQLFLVDLKTGELLKTVNTNEILSSGLDFLNKCQNGQYDLYTNKGLTELPYCNTHGIQYHEFYRLEEDFVIQCDLIYKDMVLDTPFIASFLLFFNEDLQFQKLHFLSRDREKYAQPLSVFGAFFQDSYNYFFARNNYRKEDKWMFTKYQCDEDGFCSAVGWLEGIPKLPLNLAVGLSLDLGLVYEAQGNYYINSGKGLYQLSNVVNNPTTKLINSYPLSEYEFILDYQDLGNESLVFLKFETDEAGGVKYESTFDIFLKKRDQKIDQILSYSSRKFDFNSMEVYDGELFVLLFDKKNKEHIVHRKQLDQLD